jgi:hypothetical protein
MLLMLLYTYLLSATDNITLDPSIKGVIGDFTEVSVLKAGFEGMPVENIVTLLPDGRFELDIAQREFDRLKKWQKVGLASL